MKTTLSRYESALAAQLDGDYSRVRELAREIIAEGQNEQDRAILALGYRLLGNVCLHNGDAEGAERNYHDALEHHLAMGDERGATIVKMNLATVALEMRIDSQEAGRLYEECLTVFRAHGDEISIALTIANLGEVNRLGGDYAEALACGSEALALFKQLEQHPRAAWQCINIAHYRLLRREYKEALAMLAEAHEYLQLHQNPVFVAAYFEMWFLLACELRRFAQGARLLGFVDLYRTQTGSPRLPGMMPWFSRQTERLHRHTNPESLDQYLRAGEMMSPEDADALTESIRSAVMEG